MKRKIVTTALLLAAPMFANATITNTATQQVCTQTGTDTAPVAATFSATWNTGGLNRNLDRTVYGRDIIAYKIKWFPSLSKPGFWSDWFVTGVNDLDPKTTPGTPAIPISNVNARLSWVYFYDHPHQYISCS
ncbi:conserved exported hypothetical protein [Crenothrix polyspora]|uniref:Uncharacterized protein n=1 Tax=Crenothrix polyspora TaxID=360316 RepID=A0A1R4H8Q3_9GAMM|nr:hypothetical protein [Crenothrix polyspora]SJM92411.1 conserved exported hypothetical protein [Crenothrix polyspora]